jgi:hypothetical protein
VSWRGLKWEDSWERWRETAEEMGATPYGDVVAYRNKVNDLRKRFECVREHLDATRRASTSSRSLATCRSRS